MTPTIRRGNLTQHLFSIQEFLEIRFKASGIDKRCWIQFADADNKTRATIYVHSFHSFCKLSAH